MVGLGFSCEDPPTDLPILISGHVDLSLIVARVGLNDSRFGCLVRLVRLVRCGSDLDTLIPNVGTCFGWRGSCKELEAATKLKASMLPLLTKSSNAYESALTRVKPKVLTNLRKY